VTVDAARMTMLARRGEHDELKREGEMRERRLAQIADELGTWRNRLSSAEAQLGDLSRRKSEAEDALEIARTERAAERAASEAREARAAAEARRDAASRGRGGAAAAQSRRKRATSPEDLRESLDDLPDPLPRADRIEADVNRLKRQRDALGAVNLRAEEDAKEVQEEHDTLVAKRPTSRPPSPSCAAGSPRSTAKGASGC
jgi:chromosome segregation protein